MSKLRFIERSEVVRREGCYESFSTQRVLQQYGEIEQAPNSTDGDGNPIYDGPTVEGWYDVPLVVEGSPASGGTVNDA